MKKQNFKKCIIADFINNNLFIFVSGVIAFLYCCLCVFFKTSSVYNIPVKLHPCGDFVYNVSISIIAAVIFFIAQVYIPNRRRDLILREVMKKFCKEVLLKECTILKVRIDAIRNGEKSESEILAAVDVSCQKVNGALNKALENYLTVLPEDLIKAINDVLSDDFLYEITVRASGALVNFSLEKIVQNDILYNRLWNRIDKIKIEVEKM